MKHYSVTNFLTQHSWLAKGYVAGMGVVTLRYYIGWYLVPAFVMKFTNPHTQTVVLSAWSMIGVYAFFSLLPRILGQYSATYVPLIFIIFSGADLVGTWINGNTPVSGYPYYHFEWWARWIQYSSMTTAIFWVPQHAISAWIGLALVLRAWQQTRLGTYCGMLGTGLFIWSPFSAIGVVTGGFGCLDRFPGELSGSACLFDYLLLDLFVNRFPRRAV